MKRLAILALLSRLLCAPLPPLLAQPTYVTITDNAYTPVSGTVCNGQPHISAAARRSTPLAALQRDTVGRGPTLRILVDECLPEDLLGWLLEWDVRMVQQMGWAGVKNGELLRRAEGQFDLFLTADKNLRYQQNLKGRRLAILLLPTNRLKVLQKMTADIAAAIAFVVPGEPDQYIELLQPAE